MATELERIAALETLMVAANADIAALHQEIYGPPRADSLKGRVHVLESDHVAASAAEAALSIAKELRDARWSVQRQVVTVVLTAIAILSPWAMVAYYGVKPH